MPVLTGSCSAEIEAGIERCWAVVADVERAPDWQKTLVRVEVIERDEQDRPLICDTLSDAHLTKVASRVRMSYHPPRGLAWVQIESDDLDSMEGAWELESLAPQRTRATYRLAVDPGPIGFMARPIERLITPLVMGHQARELGRAVMTSGR
jgi:hypothetical protein